MKRRKEHGSDKAEHQTAQHYDRQGSLRPSRPDGPADGAAKIDHHRDLPLQGHEWLV